MDQHCVDNQDFTRGSAVLPDSVTENCPVFFLYHFQQGTAGFRDYKVELFDHIKYLGEILETLHMVDLPPSKWQWGTNAQQCILGSQLSR